MFEPKTRILIVDDMLTIRRILGKTLRDLGFSDITEAVDGLDAWKKMDDAVFPFELVISDWNMPIAPGIELLRKVRQDQRYANIPFVLLTVESESHQIAEAIKLGVSSYILKPFTAEILKEKLEQIHRKGT